MHILITDSGVGGLSVVAYAERFVRRRGVAEPVRLTFANAAPANDYGYNSMPTEDEKLLTFDRFLRNVTDRFAPDLIYVACNTLSVLLPRTEFFSGGVAEHSDVRPGASHPPVPVKGIVETGASLLLNELEADPRSIAMIFATQTTIGAGAYPRLLIERGVDSSRIVSQACPGLADVISEDWEGTRTAPEIRRWVGTAAARLGRSDAPVVACLACTHYGYRRELFAEAFEELGIAARIVDPNERAVGDLFDPRSTGDVRDVEVRFVTRYAIPQATVEALTFYLGAIAPKTVAAMQKFLHVPDLF